VGGGVSAPVAIYKIEPEYSEEARKAKFQGTVVLSIVVDEQGLPRSFKVVKPLGLGLDEKASSGPEVALLACQDERQAVAVQAPSK